MRKRTTVDATQGNETQQIRATQQITPMDPDAADALDVIGPGLSVKQRVAVMSLVQGGNLHNAAEKVGVDRVTVWRWMRQPAFAAEFEAASDTAYRQALRELQGAMLEASDVLRTLMRSGNPAIRLRAAQAVLSLAFKARAGAATEAEADKRREEEQAFREMYGE